MRTHTWMGGGGAHYDFLLTLRRCSTAAGRLPRALRFLFLSLFHPKRASRPVRPPPHPSLREPSRYEHALSAPRPHVHVCLLAEIVIITHKQMLILRSVG